MTNIMGLFRKSNNTLETGGIPPRIDEKVRCRKCNAIVMKKEMADNQMVCPQCNEHFRIGARVRIKSMCDSRTFQELFTNMTTSDPLQFPNYREKLEKAEATSGEEEGVVCGICKFDDIPCAIFAMEPQFMMGSMGCAVGEKITLLFEYATKHHLPVIGFTCSGGARMQEGILSLMQMAKISGAVERHSKQGELYLTVLTDPTTGGVTASFAMLGDIILSEPKVTIGFAGRRVIEETTKETLPDDFQTAEFLLEHGFIDNIVPRTKLRETLSSLLKLHRKSKSNHKKWIFATKFKWKKTELEINELAPYDRVKLARSTERPTAKTYIQGLFQDTFLLHGDRKFADDKAIIGGVGEFMKLPVTFIGIQRGSNLDERIACHFGSPMPEGYRKALRLMKQAEKFHRPIICFVDTAGAFCGKDAEERGQGQAIAENLKEMMSLTVPIITIIIGEGGSGGALGLSVANKVYMLENAVYSVISPEGCASILWNHADKADEAAKSLCICAEDMVRFGVAERIVHENMEQFSGMIRELKSYLVEDLKECLSQKHIEDMRYDRFRKIK